METLINWTEKLYGLLPIPFLEVWGRFSFVVGLIVMLAAFCGYTFRPGGRWELGLHRQYWDGRALLSFVLTFGLVILSGYAGASTVLVAQAQTFETFKDLSVLLCITLLGYPALLAVPIAYGISDVIEGVPPDFIWNWLIGYFINPALFWVGTQLFARDPDFRRAINWKRYLYFVAFFMFIEPPLWGYLCAGSFPSEIAFHRIVPALAATLLLTWILAPAAFLVLFPIARRAGFFWAHIPGHVREFPLRQPESVWVSQPPYGSPPAPHTGIPIRIFIALPFIVLVLVMVGATAFVSLRSSERVARELVARLQHEAAEKINVHLDRLLSESEAPESEVTRLQANRILSRLKIGDRSREFVVDPSGRVEFTSGSSEQDLVIRASLDELLRQYPDPETLPAPTQFQVNVVTPQPLSHERWLTEATPYRSEAGENALWILMTSLPESSFLHGVRAGGSRSAMLFALFLVVAMILAATLARYVGRPIQRLALATDAVSQGKLDVTLPLGRLEEVGRVARSFNHMTHQLSSAYAELRRAKEEAESSSRVKSEFLDIAAHELRTPMTPLLLLVQLVQEDLKRGRTVQLKTMDQISRNLHRLRQLVDDLLNLSRLERGSIHLNRSREDLGALVEDTVADFRRMEPERSFVVEAAPASIVASIDPLRLQQVITNLLDNAVKYSPAGTPIEVGLSQENGTASLRVIDHGHGISAADEARLFTKFFRAQTDAKKPGLGLGLYICRKIVELHGGTIHVGRTVPSGCTVEVRLPLQTPEATHA